MEQKLDPKPIDVNVETKVSPVKTLREHYETGIKYSAPSIGAGYAVGRILVFFYPDLAPIELEIVSILSFAGNMLMILFFKSGK